MKLALIIIGVIVLACIALEFAGCIVAKRCRERFDKMSPEERFRHQSDMRKARL